MPNFADAYKIWRNRARKFNAESIIRMAMSSLQKPAPSRLEDIKGALRVVSTNSRFRTRRASYID